MEIFRICQKSFSDKLRVSGNPNRWNKEGQKVIYCASSRSLATLELIVHKNSVVPHLPYTVMVISVSDNDDLVKQVKIRSLPENWRSMAAYSSLQKIGSDWYRAGESLMLKIPSVVISHEYNYMINTEHPSFHDHVALVRREEYFWDGRLL